MEDFWAFPSVHDWGRVMFFTVAWLPEVLAELESAAMASRFRATILNQIVVITRDVQSAGEHHANKKHEGLFRFDQARIRLTMAYRDADTFEVVGWAIIK